MAPRCCQAPARDSTPGYRLAERLRHASRQQSPAVARCDLGNDQYRANNIIKVLAIVSVVGIPPTLVASMYGMNFKNMPELGWAWAYPYGLAVIAVSAIIPVLWFKWRGWF